MTCHWLLRPAPILIGAKAKKRNTSWRRLGIPGLPRAGVQAPGPNEERAMSCQSGPTACCFQHAPALDSLLLLVGPLFGASDVLHFGKLDPVLCSWASSHKHLCWCGETAAGQNAEWRMGLQRAETHMQGNQGFSNCGFGQSSVEAPSSWLCHGPLFLAGWSRFSGVGRKKKVSKRARKNLEIAGPCFLSAIAHGGLNIQDTEDSLARP